VIEGPIGKPWLTTLADARTLLEACFSARTRDALLHPANLPPEFYDLSSGFAGEYLQKWRNYRVRVALVCPPGQAPFSSRFQEMVNEEAGGGYFRIFAARAPAVEWLDELVDDAGGG
jgi:hypothetical protein